MSDPVLVEVTRGTLVESRHHGAFAISNPSGRLVASAGDIDRPVFPRSAVKALQALALVESGAADDLGLEPDELALICASHGGEPVHVETARSILAKAGRSEADLECGIHWPTHKDSARALTLDHARPTALHNNCSGKHAGFLCLACGLGTEPRGYVAPDHAVQSTIRAVLSEVHDDPLTSWGTDGCAIPTYAVPLRKLARSFARLATGLTFGPQRAAAAIRLREAVASHPVLVAGHGFLDTRLAERFGTRVLTKTGAEGVFCAAFPDLGLGLALKCDDGAPRASQAILLGLVSQLMAWSEEDRAVFAADLDPTVRNWNGTVVGRIQTTEAIALPLGR